MDDDEILNHLDRPFRLWRCPEHRNGVVTWNGDRARCETCGQTNHPMDLPGVDRVLVLAGTLREFEAWVRENQPDRLYRAKAQWGKTLYVYICQRRLLMGHNPARTRYMLVGRYWLKPELVAEATSLYAPAGIPVLVGPGREISDGVRLWTEDDSLLRQMAAFLGGPVTCPVTPESEPLATEFSTIGNPACQFNVRSRYVRCAINPKGPCEGCSDFEPREEEYLGRPK